MIVDCHTHNAHADDGIISVGPHAFDPEPGRLYSVGIHPWRTASVTASELERLGEMARHPQVAAIGETGLDSLRGGSIEDQSLVFEFHLRLAQQLRKPIVIHSVRTSQQVLAAVRGMRMMVPCVIHGMRGNERVARPLIAAGFYLSYGPHFNPLALRATPVDRLLIETDDSGVSISRVASAIAEALQMDTADIMSLASRNLSDVIGASVRSEHGSFI